MAEKDDRENLGDDLSPRRHQFLLVLSSALPDTVPLQGIELARMIQSNDGINDIIDNVIVFLLTVSAPPDMCITDESVRRRRLLMYTWATTYLRKLQKAHLAQIFPLRAAEDRHLQEDAR